MLVVFNPAAGRRRSRRLWRVLDVLVAHGVRVDVAETRRRGHATALAREAAERGARTVVAAGGDGTVAEVANGLAGSGARLGIVPLGTANVLAQELGLPADARSLAAILAFGRSRTRWPGLATGAGGQRLFVQMLGVGLDAQVVHRLPLPLKRAFGRGAYVAQTAREALRCAHRPLAVRLDGTETEAAAVIVSKGRFYAGPYLLAPDAAPGEPGFTAALFDRAGPLAALRYGAALPLNRLPRQPGLRLVRARRVEITGRSEVPAQADGDPAGTVPVSVADAAEAIDIVAG